MIREKERYVAIIHWKSAGHEWNTRKKTVMAGDLNEALDIAIAEETKPGRRLIHGKVKLESQCVHGYW